MESLLPAPVSQPPGSPPIRRPLLLASHICTLQIINDFDFLYSIYSSTTQSSRQIPARVTHEEAEAKIQRLSTDPHGSDPRSTQLAFYAPNELTQWLNERELIRNPSLGTSLVVKTPSFHYRQDGFDPWSGS